ncbi:kinesin motor domain-containing protein [Powellomyces hirtus]|nr:kinesin motor domain-containing protein [Powellomyces hirtus]
MEANPLKRARGRPPKSKDDGVKRGRGRPPKRKASEVFDNEGSAEILMPVYLRLRPTEGGEPYVKVASDTTVRVQSKEKSESFIFSKVFPDDVTQIVLFEEIMSSSVRKMFEPGESTSLLMAYGASNSGKTFTVSGTEDDPGILLRTIEQILTRIGADQSKKAYKPIQWNEVHTVTGGIVKKRQDGTAANAEFSVFLSFAEIYMDQVYDLQATATEVPAKGLPSKIFQHGATNRLAKRPTAQLHQDSEGRKYILRQRETRVKNIQEAREVVKRAMDNRSVFSTQMNEASSRSHLLSVVKVLRIPLSSDGDVQSGNIEVSRIAVLDMAGAERMTQSGVEGQAHQETKKIHTSLLALTMCVETMRANQARTGKKSLVPWRGSKLTALLQPYFEHGLPAFIINVNPSMQHAPVTSAVFGFAQSAGALSRSHKIAAPIVPVHLASEDSAYLHPEIQFLQQRLATSEYMLVQQEMKIREECAKEMSDRLRDLETRYRQRRHLAEEREEDRMDKKLDMASEMYTSRIEELETLVDQLRKKTSEQDIIIAGLRRQIAEHSVRRSSMSTLFPNVENVNVAMPDLLPIQTYDETGWSQAQSTDERVQSHEPVVLPEALAAAEHVDSERCSTPSPPQVMVHEQNSPQLLQMDVSDELVSSSASTPSPSQVVMDHEDSVQLLRVDMSDAPLVAVESLEGLETYRGIRSSTTRFHNVAEPIRRSAELKNSATVDENNTERMPAATPEKISARAKGKRERTGSGTRGLLKKMSITEIELGEKPASVSTGALDENNTDQPLVNFSQESPLVDKTNDPIAGQTACRLWKRRSDINISVTTDPPTERAASEVKTAAEQEAQASHMGSSGVSPVHNKAKKHGTGKVVRRLSERKSKSDASSTMKPAKEQSEVTVETDDHDPREGESFELAGKTPIITRPGELEQKSTEASGRHLSRRVSKDHAKQTIGPMEKLPATQIADGTIPVAAAAGEAEVAEGGPSMMKPPNDNDADIHPVEANELPSVEMDTGKESDIVVKKRRQSRKSSLSQPISQDTSEASVDVSLSESLPNLTMTVCKTGAPLMCNSS